MDYADKLDMMDDDCDIQGYPLNNTEQEFHIWLNKVPQYVTFTDTYEAIKRGEHVIHTTQIHFCSTERFNEGYRLYVHMLDGEVVEISLGEFNLYTNRDIKWGTNLEKLLLANEFGKAISE